MTQQPPESLAPALERLRRGDRAGARAAIEAALAARARRAGAARLRRPARRPDRAIPPRPSPISGARSRSPRPTSPMRVNLATALVASGALDEAAAVCAGRRTIPGCCGWPAYVHQESGRLAEAAAAYRSGDRRLPGRFRELEQSRQRPRRAGRSRRRGRRLPAGDQAQAGHRRDGHQPVRSAGRGRAGRGAAAR